MAIPVTELVGCRALLTTTKQGWGEIQEYRILEVSPSGQYVRVMNAFGTKHWKRVVDISLLEKLTDVEPYPRDKVKP